MIEFKEFVKDIGVEYESDKDWEMWLPFKSTREDIQKVIDRCRATSMVDWHIKYKNITDDNLEPKIKIYWD